MYEVEASSEQIDLLTKQLKPRGWYTHFWRGNDVIVVYPGKKFALKHSDKTTWEEALKYGQNIGIPIEQLDFVVSE